jgi:hypothetical protein
MPDDSTPKPDAPIRARRWAGSVSPPERPRPYRFALRLIGIPALAVGGLLIYNGLRDRFTLPECDSEQAKQTLSEILKQLELEPVRYEPVKMVSSSKEKVVCNAVLPLPDGANVVADFTFYWQDNKVNMKYSVSRQSP